MQRIDPRESPGFLVGRVAHALKLRVQAVLEEHCLEQSAEEVSIVTVLAHLDGPQRMKPLAELLGRDATTVSRQVAGLEEHGLVKRLPSPRDGRAIEVTLTRRGANLVERTLPLSLALREKALAGISKSDMNALTKALQRMLSNLRSEE